MKGSNYATQNTGCGCGCGGGLGESEVTTTDAQTKNQQAENTKEDIVDEVKKYVNEDIPTMYKVGAGALLVGVLWYTSNRSKNK